MYPIKVIFADDQPLLCESICALLEPEASLQITAVAHNGAELLPLVAGHQPDVVLTDFQMPGMTGAEATRAIKDRYPHIAVLGITLYPDEQRIREWREAGADGYLSKATVTRRELVEAIRSVAAGRPFYPRQDPALLRPRKDASLILLSEKEVRIIRLICEQYSSKQIAPLVNLTSRSVEIYRDRIMEKIGADNVVGVVLYAIRKGLFTV